ncbi:ABC-2 type transport system permease protein [Amycolatopsis bartoniae]|uniref:Transport permease protein n=1 Tax=Amycolatopsis bartoniae TaxID=941986 RepID=A0A8H9M8R1_9PSEU|nr:ABC transporter permease [Amycolatopsis bartoniae]MBB2935351.1 ABC-2 type transport system permease protein [Amycolatopsis bartoniae]TVS99826.1 ABC transporter permease [Amycolatopsis bartoniae]GHF85425.1 transport permease protein [Amycolatopsis bartoniae]
MLTKLTLTEAKLFLRDPAAPIAVAGIPLGLLLVFGLQPGIRQPSADFGGQVPLSAFIAPLALAVLLGMLALTVFPAAIATYREKGVLRRLSASPVPPSRLLTAQLLVNVVAALVVVVLVLGVGTLALRMAAPANPGGFLLVLVLGALALFAVGTVIAALAPSGKVASGIGSAVFFPMLALGGVWVPKEQLPGFLRHVADVLPLGATLNALRQAATGAAPSAVQLVSLAVVAAGCGAVAVRWFRWE